MVSHAGGQKRAIAILILQVRPDPIAHAQTIEPTTPPELQFAHSCLGCHTARSAWQFCVAAHCLAETDLMCVPPGVLRPVEDEEAGKVMELGAIVATRKASPGAEITAKHIMDVSAKLIEEPEDVAARERRLALRVDAVAARVAKHAFHVEDKTVGRGGSPSPGVSLEFLDIRDQMEVHYTWPSQVHAAAGLPRPLLMERRSSGAGVALEVRPLVAPSGVRETRQTQPCPPRPLPPQRGGRRRLWPALQPPPMPSPAQLRERRRWWRDWNAGCRPGGGGRRRPPPLPGRRDAEGNPPPRRRGAHAGRVAGVRCEGGGGTGAAAATLQPGRWDRPGRRPPRRRPGTHWVGRTGAWPAI